jgi:F-type H+-transporting ATPase subunit delta
MSTVADTYADAVLAVAAAEGAPGLTDELYAVAQAVESNDQLASTLADRTVPVERRQQIIEDVLGGKASDAARGLVSMIVAAGRSNELGEIARAAAGKAAESGGRQLAEVRSAVPLSEDQVRRLAASLQQATGADVDVKVVVDPSVVGGLVTQIGDTVIDGSLRRRLNQMRDAIAS